MNKKIVGIFVMALIILAGILPIIGTANFGKDDKKGLNIWCECDPTVELVKKVSDSEFGPWYSNLFILPPYPKDIWFKIEVTNIGDDQNAFAYFVKDELPEGMNFIEAFKDGTSSGPNVYDSATHTVTWEWDDVTLTPHITNIFKINANISRCVFNIYENFAYVKYSACGYTKLGESDIATVACCNNDWICIPSMQSNTVLVPSMIPAVEVTSPPSEWTDELEQECGAKWLWNKSNGKPTYLGETKTFSTIFDLPCSLSFGRGILRISADDEAPTIKLNGYTVGSHVDPIDTAAYDFVSTFPLYENWFLPTGNTLTVTVKDQHYGCAGGIWCIYICCMSVNESASDLKCSGELSWTDETPGSKITGVFQVKNIGEEESLLNWEITEYPEWGTWSFDPSSGRSLKPEDGPVEVKVEVNVPDEENTEFTGAVKIVNKDNSSDYCTIPVALSTPKNTVLNLPPWFQRLEEYCPLLFQVFQELLGL